MLKFTKNEIAFMEQHALNQSEFLDVRGSRPRDWKVIAKEMGYPFVVADSCRHGHRIRTRSNSCCQCHPAAIRFQRRHSEPGWVYLAYSPAGQLTKVGSSADVAERVYALNNQGYADEEDWLLVGQAFVQHMGRVEHSIQSSLPGKVQNLGYLHRFDTEDTREAYRCPPQTAWWHFVRVVNSANGQAIWKHPDLKYL